MRQLADVIPVPARVRPEPADAFRIAPTTVLRTAPGSVPARRVGEQLAALLRPATGFAVPVEEYAGASAGAVSLLLEAGAEAEAYRLDVTADAVTVRAADPAGLHAGVQTLRQLLPAEIEADRPQRCDWVLPGGRIVDRPRFGYRGAMLDLARHFVGPDGITRYIDQIVQFKINHLHLHLTDDQGWRIEIDGWPRLTAVGGGPGTGVGGVGPGFLTAAQYADVVAYAAERFVTVVPEIDLPGHTNAALSAYAELNADGRPAAPRTDMRVGYSSLLAGHGPTRRFVADVVRQVAALSPGAFLHIGGDEARATSDADYRAFMAELLPLVESCGKRPVGWHELARVEPGPATVVQYWGVAGAGDTERAVAAAAARGNSILMSPADRCYLDMKYDPTTRLGLTWAGAIDVERAYDWDPANRVPGVGAASVLGVEAPLWSETLRGSADIESMAFPRLPAIAEVGWSPAASHDWADFRRRLAGFAPRWRRQRVNFHRDAQVPWPD